MTENKARSILWSAPRCTSTAFEYAIRRGGGVAVVHEAYTDAAYFGAERWLPRYLHLPTRPGLRYADVRRRLECDFDKTGVFVKDMAYALGSNFDALPRNFAHAMLIRDPRRAIPSMYKIAISGDAPEWADFLPIETGFDALCSLYEHLCSQNLEPLVIESADLLSKPKTVLQAFCEHSGIEYSHTMISWPEEKHIKEWESWGPVWYHTLLSARGFSDRGPTSLPSLANLPLPIRSAITAAMPYYKRLYSRKLII